MQRLFAVSMLFGLFMVPAVSAAQSPRFRSVTASFEGTCALTDDGRAWCWGAGAAFGRRVYTPAPLAGVVRLAALALDFRTACGIDAQRVLHCRGAQGGGLLGDSSPMSTPNGNEFRRYVFGPVAGPHRFSALGMRSGTACGVADEGRIWCWGSNPNGQFGNGTRTVPGVYTEAIGMGSRVPVPALAPVPFTSVDVAHRHGCAVAADGSAWCWGTNEFGQLGDGTTSEHLEPTPVRGGHHFRQVSVSNFATCGATTEGIGLCWGSGTGGAIGDGALENRAEPTPVAGADRWRAIETSQSTSCGLTEDGAAWCWGQRVEGGSLTPSPDGGPPRLTPGTAVRTLVPERVPGGLRFTSLSLGIDHRCGVTVDGEVWCWGQNHASQLGVPSTEVLTTNTPQRVRFP